jgi:hypothetical protein
VARFFLAFAAGFLAAGSGANASGATLWIQSRIGPSASRA